ncbi:hypothetical protein PtA15_7A314 [Puccinia triticina]|uniref:Exocyst complex component Sec8 n=1 Tax=Puccinia triticina TaxID=208348 RepID=A0ABY7CMZ2_9BASI|nr:uncharacterized protein PtA15_7A314 [Puccinia triticina]WAQ86588.1 hypothetical protein PtA15_7A314 [Puccinia triticina]WAR56448.1 hypothetical protein PtB15_7B297 [Puccinia triticina]
MSDLEASFSGISTTDSESPSDIEPVHSRLAEIAHEFRMAPGALYRLSRNNKKMIDELGGRNVLIDQLESTLLPSLKDHVSSLLLLLDLQDFGTQLDTHAKLGRCKEFRCRRLCIQVERSIQSHLCLVFHSAAELTRLWELSRHDPENLIKHQKLMSEKMEQICTKADLCYQSLDQSIQWSTKSDLVILQEDWLDTEAGLVNITLKHLTKLANPLINDFEYHEWDSINVSREKTTTPNREHNAQVARLTIPIVKLARIFLKQMANTTAAKRQLFTLDPDIDSKSLCLLSQGPSNLAMNLRAIALFLAKCQERNMVADMEAEAGAGRQSNPVLDCAEHLESTLLLLSSYLIPFPTTVDDFMSGFSDLRSLYHRATDRMLDTLFRSEHLDLE